MREELERRLGTEFPFMRQSKDEWVHCDCGDGWYDLIRELCKSISERYTRDGKTPDITVLQVKEKYGELRFYYEHEKMLRKADILDFPTEKDTRSMQNNKAARQLREDIGEIVWQFEDRSSMVCEECGSAGETRTDLFQIRTLCGDCYAKLKERL